MGLESSVSSLTSGNCTIGNIFQFLRISEPVPELILHIEAHDLIACALLNIRANHAHVDIKSIVEGMV